MQPAPLSRPKVNPLSEEPMSDPSEPRVFLVGAGPGDPGLLTLRAAELLARADLVLYDQLVPRRLLDLANPAAERVCVRDLPGQHPDKYPHIHALLIEAARAGKTVVRLKGGDPLVFGRGGEEAETLRAAGVAYEIVPGVTAALAAAAYLDIPLTHRQHASAVALVTGHELPNKPGNRLDWEALAAFPGTLAIYMGIARLPLIVAELLKHGKDPDTPAAIVERASTGDMRIGVRAARGPGGGPPPRRAGGAGPDPDRRRWSTSGRPGRGSRSGRCSASGCWSPARATRPGRWSAGSSCSGRCRTCCRPSRSATRPTSGRSTGRLASCGRASGTGSSSPAPTASTRSSAGSKRSAATCATWAG